MDLCPWQGLGYGRGLLLNLLPSLPQSTTRSACSCPDTPSSCHCPRSTEQLTPAPGWCRLSCRHSEVITKVLYGMLVTVSSGTVLLSDCAVSQSIKLPSIAQLITCVYGWNDSIGGKKDAFVVVGLTISHSCCPFWPAPDIQGCLAGQRSMGKAMLVLPPVLSIIHHLSAYTPAALGCWTGWEFLPVSLPTCDSKLPSPANPSLGKRLGCHPTWSEDSKFTDLAHPPEFSNQSFKTYQEDSKCIN